MLKLVRVISHQDISKIISLFHIMDYAKQNSFLYFILISYSHALKSEILSSLQLPRVSQYQDTMHLVLGNLISPSIWSSLTPNISFIKQAKLLYNLEVFMIHMYSIIRAQEVHQQFLRQDQLLNFICLC